MFYVYILANTSQTFHYIGLTRNLERRIDEHVNGLSPVTKTYCPLILMWYCVFTDRSLAAQFEQYLKSGSGRAFAKKRLLV